MLSVQHTGEEGSELYLVMNPAVKDYPFHLQPHLLSPVGDVMPPCIS